VKEDEGAIRQGVRLTSVEPTPSLPPQVWANDVQLSITQYEWATPDGFVSHIVEKPEDAVITPVRLATRTLRLTISPSAKPFADADEYGFPLVSSGSNIDCFESDQCRITFEDSSMNVEVDQVGTFRFAVIRVAYFNGALATTQEKMLSTASWVMSFAT
jgi:hypothetical protein